MKRGPTSPGYGSDRENLPPATTPPSAISLPEVKRRASVQPDVRKRAQMRKRRKKYGAKHQQGVVAALGRQVAPISVVPV